MPAETVKCIESWKRVMPEYELVLWDMDRFDVSSVPFVEVACYKKKWAAAADYIRLYSVYTEGGIYMDTDVYTVKPFDDLLSNAFFTAIECIKPYVESEDYAAQIDKNGLPKTKDVFAIRFGLQAAVFGGIKGHPFLYSCMDWYKDNPISMSDGTYLNPIIAPRVYAQVALEYGFCYKDEMQYLAEGVVIYPSSLVAVSPYYACDDNYGIHCTYGSWLRVDKRIRRKLAGLAILRKLFRKKPIIELT